MNKQIGFIKYTYHNMFFSLKEVMNVLLVKL